MKFNKWTLGLAAVGAVSLTSVAQAEEKAALVQAALTSTTISGYVDTSAQWNLGTGSASLPGYSFGGTTKADGFNLNVVQLTIAKALDESEWSSGYRADLWFGPDATGLASQFTAGGDLAIRQAYVTLRTPLGNGLDWKIGVFDTIIGYETLESGSNPNYTRSYGFSAEPTTHTGALATYRVNDSISASAGIANTFGPQVNGRANPPKVESSKTYLASVALTAPSDWGWVAGSSLYLGVIGGFNANQGGYAGAGTETHYYGGVTLATPVTGLKVGAALDILDVADNPASGGNATILGVYGSFQATEKLSFHSRAEYVTVDGKGAPFTALGFKSSGGDANGYEFTVTAQYDLWQNVISRAELRWDHAESGSYGTLGNQNNAVLAAVNLIYKF